MKKKILCLVMTLVMTAGAATTAFARDYQGADGWQVTFDGSKMSSNFQDNDVTDEMANIQPGDSIELKVNVMNSDSGSTDCGRRIQLPSDLCRQRQERNRAV